MQKWLPIVTRLEEQFKSHEKAKSIGYKTYAEQVFTELDQLKAENKRLDNELYMTVEEGRAWYDLMERYEQALTEIKEIAEAHKKYIYVLPSYSVAGDSLEFSFEFTKEILQKCEVLDE